MSSDQQYQNEHLVIGIYADEQDGRWWSRFDATGAVGPIGDTSDDVRWRIGSDLRRLADQVDPIGFEATKSLATLVRELKGIQAATWAMDRDSMTRMFFMGMIAGLGLAVILHALGVPL